MRIKRFEAKDSTTALAMIKKEMGEDAVILATKKIPGPGARGAGVEVVAAVDYDMDDIAVPPPEEPCGDVNEQGGSNQAGTYNYQSIRRPVSSQPLPATSKPVSAKPVAPNKVVDAAPAKRSEIQSEAHDLRLRFANLLRPPKKEGDKQVPGQQTKKRNQAGAGKPSAAKQEDVAKWRDQLIDKIQYGQPGVTHSADGGQVLALVGATGVGKTTTAAKLAAWYSLRQGRRVCLLSMDCYRIGATDQLRTYARIMRVPCEVVLRKEDLAKALQRHADKLVIIDTAGKSPYDEQHISELIDWFRPVKEISSHLVLSATTKKEDIQHVLNSYKPLDIESMILTKLDETRAYAALCHQVVASALPVSYLCTGQRVPEDFLIARKDFLDTLFKHGWEAVTSHFGERITH